VPTRPKWPAIVLAASLAAAATGFWRMYTLAAADGAAFPEYSSLRSDKQGALAFYLSLSELPGMHVRRNFEPVQSWKPTGATLLFLGELSGTWMEAPLEEFDAAERLAKAGNRVVIVLRYSRRPIIAKPAKDPDRPKLVKPADRWGISIREITVSKQRNAPPLLVLDAQDSNWSPGAYSKILEKEELVAAERRFESGSVAIIASGTAFLNVSLRDKRDTSLLAWAAQSSQGRIVFDEAHLGTTTSGSVAGLIRRFRLEWTLAVFILAGLLFVWRQSSPLLPPRPPEPPKPSPAGAQTGLAGLLRRNTSEAALPALLSGLFDQGIRFQPAITGPRAAAVRQLLSGPKPDWAILWSRLHRTLRGNS